MQEQQDSIRKRIAPAGMLELRHRAQQAADAGDTVELVRILLEGGVLDGIYGWVRRKWGALPDHDIDAIIAETIDILCAHIKRVSRAPAGKTVPASRRRGGDRVRDVFRFITGTARNLAAARDAVRLYGYPDGDGTTIVDPSTEPDYMADEEEQAARYERRRRRSIEVARQAVACLFKPGNQITSVMEYLVEAVDKQVPCTATDIAHALGLPPDSVYKQLTRGIQKIAEFAKASGVSDEFDETNFTLGLVADTPDSNGEAIEDDDESSGSTGRLRGGTA